MRKFFPRFFNVIIAILCLFLIFPWRNLFQLVNNLGLQFATLANFFYNFEWLKVSYIPLFIFVISLLYLIVASIDYKKHDKQTTKPLKNGIYDPLWFFGVSCSILGLVSALFFKKGLVILSTDWYGLGILILKTPVAAFISTNPVLYAIILYATLLVIQIVLALFGKKNMDRHGFVGNFFMWLLFVLLAFISIKGVQDSLYQNGSDISINALVAFSFKEIYYLSSYHSIFYGSASLLLFEIIVLALFVIYAVLASIVCHKNNVLMAEGTSGIRVKSPKKNNEEKAAKKENDKNNKKQANNAVTEFVPNVPTNKAETNVGDNLFVLPKPEEVVETVIEEKTVINQLIFEKSDLNDVFGTDFGFKNCTMVKKEGLTDYYVNKQKFLTISNNGKSLSFRLELDKAIRLIIQYPLIGKDKYENHKIWFKIEDISILNKDTIIGIIKDAYDTVINNL